MVSGRQLLVEHLDLVNGSHNRRSFAQQVTVGQQPHLQIGEPPAFANPDTLSVHRDRAAHDEIDWLHVMDINRLAKGDPSVRGRGCIERTAELSRI